MGSSHRTSFPHKRETEEKSFHLANWCGVHTKAAKRITFLGVTTVEYTVNWASKFYVHRQTLKADTQTEIIVEHHCGDGLEEKNHRTLIPACVDLLLPDASRSE